MRTMRTMRTMEKMTGFLFFVSTASYLIGSGLIDAVLGKGEPLAVFYPERFTVYSGLFLELINGAAVVGIAVLLFPILKRRSESAALGYFSSRVIEAVLLVVSIIAQLLLLALSKHYGSGNGADADTHEAAIGNLLVTGQEMIFQLAMLALGLGSIVLCYHMFRTKLVPRSLSLLGLFGYVALTGSSCLSILGYEPGALLFIPGGLFEVIFPLWLIFKGFDRTALDEKLVCQNAR